VNPNIIVGGNVSGSTASFTATITGLVCASHPLESRPTTVFATFTGHK
jgi:hypothetical protein